MNFRDVLKAAWPLSGRNRSMPAHHGDEVAGDRGVGGRGRDACGAEVTASFGIAVFGLATHTLARGGDVPENSGRAFL